MNISHALRKERKDKTAFCTALRRLSLDLISVPGGWKGKGNPCNYAASPVVLRTQHARNGNDRIPKKFKSMNQTLHIAVYV